MSSQRENREVKKRNRVEEQIFAIEYPEKNDGSSQDAYDIIYIYTCKKFPMTNDISKIYSHSPYYFNSKRLP